MAPGATKPYQPPETPAGKVNLTDPDSRLVKAMRGWIQGHDAQAAVNEHQIVLADAGYWHQKQTCLTRERSLVRTQPRP
jgi:hypothetical protein